MEKKKKMSTRILVIILMALSLVTIYVLPYLKYTYFTPLQEAMGLVGENQKFGNLTSVYGIMNVIFYLPGGIISDRFDPKKLLVFSMISSGALGLWMATWPSYGILLLIHALWSVTTVLTYWSSSIKCINLISDEDEQGSSFGLLEGGRGIISLIMSGIWLAAFSYFARQGGNRGITFVVVCVSVLMILVGVLLYFFMPNTATEESTNTNLKESILAVGRSFKLPITWILSGMIFASSAILASASYYAPYLQAFFGLSVTAVASFQYARNNGMNIAAAPIAAGSSKKMGRSSKIIFISIASMAILNVVLAGLSTQHSTKWLWPLMILMCFITFFSYMNRSLYWATIDETGTPKNMVGSVIGAASLFGYLPDTFIHTMYGNWLDNLDEIVAYRRIFIFCIVVCVVAAILAFLGEKQTLKHQAKMKVKDSKISNNA